MSDNGLWDEHAQWWIDGFTDGADPEYVEQIIPLPETKEFMIDAQEKQKEENDKSKTIEESEVRLVKFWG